MHPKSAFIPGHIMEDQNLSGVDIVSYAIISMIGETKVSTVSSVNRKKITPKAFKASVKKLAEAGYVREKDGIAIALVDISPQIAKTTAKVKDTPKAKRTISKEAMSILRAFYDTNLFPDGKSLFGRPDFVDAAEGLHKRFGSETVVEVLKIYVNALEKDSYLPKANNPKKFFQQFLSIRSTLISKKLLKDNKKESDDKKRWEKYDKEGVIML